MGVRSRGSSAGFVLAILMQVVVLGVVAPRPLREAGLHVWLGPLACGLLLVAAWAATGGIRSAVPPSARAALAAGVLLVAPFALLALLWVGLGTPWEASPAENRMRYLVLLSSAVLVTMGYLALWQALAAEGPRVRALPGLAAAMLAGATYVVWTCYETGVYLLLVRDGTVPDAVRALSPVFDVMLFAACVLTYVANAAFALAIGAAGWTGRLAARALAAFSLLLLGAILLRGLSFPAPGGETPWWLRPGFIAGIPAIPWLASYWFGVLALRRSGDVAAAAQRGR